jgi:hypothetical protein
MVTASVHKTWHKYFRCYTFYCWAGSIWYKMGKKKLIYRMGHSGRLPDLCCLSIFQQYFQGKYLGSNFTLYRALLYSIVWLKLYHKTILLIACTVFWLSASSKFWHTRGEYLKVGCIFYFPNMFVLVHNPLLYYRFLKPVLWRWRQ